MGTIAGHVTGAANRHPGARLRTLRPLKREPRQAETAAAAVALVTDLLSQASVSEAAGWQALERLVTRARAAKTAVWSVTNKVATRLLEPHIERESQERLTDHSTVLTRLYRHGALICHSGDVSGLEDLVPAGVRSFVIAAGPKTGDAFGILVLGWSSVCAPCDESAVTSLRIASALLHHSLTNRTVQPLGFTDVVLASLLDRIVVLDRNGHMLASNAASPALPSDDESPTHASSAGLSYGDIIRRAFDDSDAIDAAPILEGVLGVARGQSDFYQAAYPERAVQGADQWCVITATPLQHPAGGAVIAHTQMTPERVIASARRTADRAFHRLVDAIPVPIWILASDGRLLYANARWLEIVNGDSARPAETRDWTDAFHPGDRERATAMFRAAVLNRATSELELRVKLGCGGFQWSACVVTPSIAIDGSLEGYVGFCRDISAQRRAESALRETALKLVAAQEDERSHIGRELHDDLGQRATILAAKLETLARNPRTSTFVRAALADAQDSVQELAVAIHNLSHRLHPARLKLLGLVNTLEAMCREVSKEKSVRVHFNAEGIANVPQQIALCVFRVAQEALQNAVKHSAARDVDVRLLATRSRLTLRVNDKGRGFDPLASEAIGIGLLTMRERVELSGGQLTVQAAEGRGTRIEAVLPLRENDTDAA